MSRLTIAIPTFRRPEDLKRAVGGVLEQASELAAGPTAEVSGPRTDAEAGTEGDAAGATDVDGGPGYWARGRPRRGCGCRSAGAFT